MKFGIVASIRRYQKQIGSLFVREDVAKYNIGVTMGIVMISIFAISLIVAVILTILARKEGKS